MLYLVLWVKVGCDFTAPNQVWLADITYIPTREDWLYLAVMLDMFLRRVVGWTMRETMPQELTIDALQMAITQRRPGPGLVHHSDRGVQLGFSRSSQQSCELTVSVRQMPLQVFSSQGSCAASC